MIREEDAMSPLTMDVIYFNTWPRTAEAFTDRGVMVRLRMYHVRNSSIYPT